MPKQVASKEVIEEPADKEEIDSEASDQLMDRLFSDEPVVEPKKDDAVEDEPDDGEEVPDGEEPDGDEPDDGEEVPDGEDGEEEDWDEPTKKKDSDSDDDDVPKDESAAQKQARLKGREAKELKAKLTERELEVENYQKKVEELQARIDEIEATKIKPEDHPEYTSLREEILTDVSEASDLLSIPDPSLLTKSFGIFMTDYLKMSSLSGEERSQVRSALKASIATTLGLTQDPYDELDESEKSEIEPVITDVLKIIQRNAGKTKNLQKLHSTLSEKAKTGLLSVGVKQYENTVNEFRPVLDSVGSLAEDVIEANPHAVESVVSKLVRESPEAARRLEKAKADVMEVIVGPRALTQAEIDKLEAAGENVKEFMAERAKSHRAKQKKFAAMFVQGLMTRSTLKETMARLAKLEKEADAEESELDVLRKTSKKAPLPKKEEKKGPKNPLVDILGFAPDDDD